MSSLCFCVNNIANQCEAKVEKFEKDTEFKKTKVEKDEWEDLANIGYTCTILFIFSTIIILILVRSMNLGKSSLEITDVLEEMRNRENEEGEKRRRKRLYKTKQKVIGWLDRKRRRKSSSKKSDRKIQLERIEQAGSRRATVSKKELNCGYLPEIVVTGSAEQQFRRRPPPIMIAQPSTEVEPNIQVNEDSGSETMSLSPALLSPTTSIFSMQFDFNYSETCTSDSDNGSTRSGSHWSNELLAVPQRRSKKRNSMHELGSFLQRSASGKYIRRSSRSFPNIPGKCDDDDDDLAQISSVEQQRNVSYSRDSLASN